MTVTTRKENKTKKNFKKKKTHKNDNKKMFKKRKTKKNV